jgi:hypothetical protein
MNSKLRKSRIKVGTVEDNKLSEVGTILPSNEFTKSLFIGLPAVLLTSLGLYIAISGLVVIFLEIAL